MFLLVLAHPGCPGEIPQSHKTVVSVCNSVSKLRRLTYFTCHGKMHAELIQGIFQLNCEVNFNLCMEKLTLTELQYPLHSLQYSMSEQ